MISKTGCTFCDIIAGKSEAYTIFEDKMALCILDICPFAKGHCLVMPKRHVTWWHEMTIRETAHIFRTARMISHRMMKAFTPEFVFMYAWGLRIPHAHIHLIPSTKDDVFDRFFHALEKVQESPRELARAGERDQMLDAMKLLLKTEYLEEKM
jgi:histidine triad (HIT) family protein